MQSDHLLLCFRGARLIREATWRDGIEFASHEKSCVSKGGGSMKIVCVKSYVSKKGME